MDAKPVALTQDDGSYDGYTPQPLVVVGGNAIIDVTAISGYDAGETQTLKNVSGTLTWVTDV